MTLKHTEVKIDTRVSLDGNYRQTDCFTGKWIDRQAEGLVTDTQDDRSANRSWHVDKQAEVEYRHTITAIQRQINRKAQMKKRKQAHNMATL